MNNKKLSLHKAYKDYFPIGAAVNARSVKSHQELLLQHFNSITLENEMKFEFLHPAEGMYTFPKADMIVDFARQNNMKVRGHTLVWHKQTPQWVFTDNRGDDVTREILLKRIQDHINTVTGRYNRDVYCWDVVNEAVDEGKDSLRNSKWLSIIGEDYVEKMFIYAHEAAPEALLFYNDYDAMYPGKRDKIIRLIRDLKAKGIPIHGIGLQGHWNIYSPTPDEIKQAIEMYAEVGVQLQITELDVSLYAFKDKFKLNNPSPELFEKQATFYETIFAIFRQYRQHISGVTLWGIADDITWLDNFPVRNRKNWPLLFDTSHVPKTAFDKVAYFRA